MEKGYGKPVLWIVLAGLLWALSGCGPALPPTDTHPVVPLSDQSPTPTPTPSAAPTHLVINELYFDHPAAIEIYNPTNQLVNLKDWTVYVFRSQFSSTTLPMIEDIVIPPGGYLVIFDGEPRPEWGQVDPTGMLYILGNCWMSRGQGAVELVDNNGMSVDFVQYNTDTFLPLSGSWEGVITATASSLARKVKTPLDTDSASDWENTYVTLGLANNTNGNFNIPVIVE